MPLSALRAALLCLFLPVLISATLLAGVSPQYREWRNGPAQWIMTSDEQRTWREVRTDSDAIHFIDLFWVRRDPTPGTPRNEFLESFNQRVLFADQKFGEPGRRGAITDRGRVFVVLGPPDNFSTQSGGTGSGHSLNARFDWRWEHATAQKYGLPRIEVVFVKAAEGARVDRDPTRADFLSAAPIAIRQAIISPSLTDLPRWALQGGLNPQGPDLAPLATTSAAVATLPAGAAAGLSHLTLIRDISAISAEAPDNPFEKMVAVEGFHPNETLGWVALYCDATTFNLSLGFVVNLSGEDDDRMLNRSTVPETMLPERMRSLSGCYLLRGRIPLTGIPTSSGRHQLQLTVDNPVTGKTETLTKEFRIE